MKLVGIDGAERFLNFVLSAGKINPESLDVVNFDKLIENYGDQTSMVPGVVRDPEQVAGIRQARAQAQQAQMQSDMLKQNASAAKDLSQADLGGDNALAALTAQAN